MIGKLLPNSRMSELANGIDGPIIVLGVERSGTSVLAEMIHRWGATWWDANFHERMKEKASDPKYKKIALVLLGEMRKEGRPWFWKDPALCHFLPFWKQLWCDPLYVITVRHPLDTAVSWQRFIMPPKLEGNVSFIPMNLLRWQHMMMQILEHTTGTTHRLFVPYEEVIRNPRAQTQRLSAFLNSRYGNRMSRVNEMIDVVDSELCHYNCNTPFQDATEATCEQKALYVFIQSMIDNPQLPFDKTAYPMPPGHREFLKVQDALIRAYDSTK